MQETDFAESPHVSNRNNKMLTSKAGDENGLNWMQEYKLQIACF